MGCFVDEIGIENGHGGHSLNDGHSTRQHARIVATTRVNGDEIAVNIYRFLRKKEGGDRLESHTEGNGLTIADAPWDAAGMVGDEGERVVLLTATLTHSSEALAVLKAFYGIDR